MGVGGRLEAIAAKKRIAMAVPAMGMSFPIFVFACSNCMVRKMARMKPQCTANFIFNTANRVKKVNGASIRGILRHAIKPYSKKPWYNKPNPGTLSVAS